MSAFRNIGVNRYISDKFRCNTLSLKYDNNFGEIKSNVLVAYKANLRTQTFTQNFQNVSLEYPRRKKKKKRSGKYRVVT